MENPIKSALSILVSERKRLEQTISEAMAIEARCAGRTAELMKMPISLDDYGVFFREHIERQGRAWADEQFVHLMLSQSGGADPANKKELSGYQDELGEHMVHLPMGRAEIGRRGDAFGLLCFYDPEGLHERTMNLMRERIGERWGNEDLPTVAKRNEEMAALREQARAARVKREGAEAQLAELVGA